MKYELITFGNTPQVRLMGQRRGILQRIGIYQDESTVTLNHGGEDHMTTLCLPNLPRKLSEYSDDKILTLAQRLECPVAELTEARDLEKEYRQRQATRENGNK